MHNVCIEEASPFPARQQNVITLLSCLRHFAQGGEKCVFHESTVAKCPFAVLMQAGKARRNCCTDTQKTELVFSWEIVPCRQPSTRWGTCRFKKKVRTFICVSSTVLWQNPKRCIYSYCGKSISLANSVPAYTSSVAGEWRTRKEEYKWCFQWVHWVSPPSFTFSCVLALVWLVSELLNQRQGKTLLNFVAISSPDKNSTFLQHGNTHKKVVFLPIWPHNAPLPPRKGHLLVWQGAKYPRRPTQTSISFPTEEKERKKVQ